MESIKNAVFTACLCAILTSAVQLLSAERMKKEMRLICGLVLVICIAAQISGENMELSLSAPVMENDAEYEQLNEDYRQTILDETRRNIEDAVMEKLNEQGIAAEKISIVCTLDEYNSVEAEKACIYLDESASDSDISAAENAAALLLPDTEIEAVRGS